LAGFGFLLECPGEYPPHVINTQINKGVVVSIPYQFDPSEQSFGSFFFLFIRYFDRIIFFCDFFDLFSCGVDDKQFIFIGKSPD